MADEGLNPLKRVNSILTVKDDKTSIQSFILVSIPSNGSIQFLHLVNLQVEMSALPEVSIPSNGSIQFLPVQGWALPEFGAIVSIPSNGSIQFFLIM